MVVQQPLPPSGRDFEVFRRVRVDQWSTRAAAEEAGISQTRVRQIVERVDAFLQESTSHEKSAEGRSGRVWLAEQIASERVGLMIGKALRAFESERLGRPTYLLAAGRLALYGSKLPMSSIGYGTFEDEEEETKAAAKVEPAAAPPAEAPRAVEPIAPPVRDCSPPAQNQPIVAEEKAPPVVASPIAQDDSEPDYRLAAKLNVTNERPAQSEDNSQKKPTSGKRLNRKQRRARLQLLQASG